MLKIWGRTNSLNVQKVLWLVGELGVEHQSIPAGGDYGGLDDPDFRAMNPHGMVPVIRDGEVTLWESHAILRYLAERFGGARFWPDLATRAAIEPWMDWEQTEFQPSFSNGLFWGYFRTPAEAHDGPAIRKAMERCAAQLTVLDTVLQTRPFLADDALTLADIPIGTCLYRYFEMGLATPRLAHVDAWYRRLCERPAYQEHIMQPFENLRGRLSY